MRWQRLRKSSNIDDVRGRRPMRRRLGIPMGGRGGSLGLIAVLVVAALLGGPEVFEVLVGAGDIAVQPSVPSRTNAADDDLNFVAAVLGSTEDIWAAIYAESGRTYQAPTLTLFDGSVDSACGFASAAAGPFYCPRDRQVYLDTSFFAELARMGSPGDFAQAYVIGHEIGHHVQNLLGVASRVRTAQQEAGGSAANRLQVALELQADCYAGVWAHHANQRDNLLEPGDIEEGLAAAAAIGDDRLQRNAGRRVTPDSFTHGSSAERQRWLSVGLRSGDPAACETFD